MGAVYTRPRDLGVTAPTGLRWSDHEGRLRRGSATFRDAMAMLPSRTREPSKTVPGSSGTLSERRRHETPT